ncbi:hypothetical protein SKAU_G00181740 [Synaphobranchus kaupii]|uniref:Uncharacterized protein n=1 Tax=Synaphobranchus kaupii TaxID=118154 RepID=A0A9Q1IZL4_SYNKA|nr:hypothetical protein SKAU_G00181740 [Synaphobranchus kaupii]
MHEFTAEWVKNCYECVCSRRGIRCCDIYAKRLELHTHLILGAQPIRHLLYPGGARALHHRRVHRVFMYYHTLANTRAYQQSRRARVWFPMFSFFERNVRGPVPNEYCWPFDKQCHENADWLSPPS